MNYQEIFLEFVNSLSEANLEAIGKTQADIYWDGNEFYSWGHDVRNDRGDFKVFDSYADDDFDAKPVLIDFADVVNDHFIQMV